MSNEQLYMAIGIPLAFNALLFTLLFFHMNTRFDAMDRRFTDMRDLWRAELNRVEGVFDARLKHIEEELDRG